MLGLRTLNSVIKPRKPPERWKNNLKNTINAFLQWAKSEKGR